MIQIGNSNSVAVLAPATAPASQSGSGDALEAFLESLTQGKTDTLSTQKSRHHSSSVRISRFIRIPHRKVLTELMLNLYGVSEAEMLDRIQILQSKIQEGSSLLSTGQHTTPEHALEQFLELSYLRSLLQSEGRMMSESLEQLDQAIQTLSDEHDSFIRSRLAMADTLQATREAGFKPKSLVNVIDRLVNEFDNVKECYSALIKEFGREGMQAGLLLAAQACRSALQSRLRASSEEYFGIVMRQLHMLEMILQMLKHHLPKLRTRMHGMRINLSDCTDEMILEYVVSTLAEGFERSQLMELARRSVPAVSVEHV